MSKIANTEGISIGDNAGKVGADNEIDVKGGLGKDVSLGNTGSVTVLGDNTASARIGADNSYKIQGGLADGASVGNTSNVLVGANSGSIGAGNKVNIG